MSSRTNMMWTAMLVMTLVACDGDDGELDEEITMRGGCSYSAQNPPASYPDDELLSAGGCDLAVSGHGKQGFANWNFIQFGGVSTTPIDDLEAVVWSRHEINGGYAGPWTMVYATLEIETDCDVPDAPHCLHIMSGEAPIPIEHTTFRVGTRAIDDNGTPVRLKHLPSAD
jgi:hypothetical protein